MKKLLIVSNRLPFHISFDDKEEPVLIPSVGGVATGMRSVYQNYDCQWIGWSGISDATPDQKKKIDRELKRHNCIAVDLTHTDVELFYQGFSNNCIWPLFHYFTEYSGFEEKEWQGYLEVNKKFANVVSQHIRKDESIWIHDYHLLMLPGMIKEEYPDINIGFFLHIPFPSYEIFRNMPWREEILQGMLGADLIGFHTYDYERHFISSVRRLLGYDADYKDINLENRVVHVDSFPMGIDFNRFHNAALANLHKSLKEKSKVQVELEKYLLVNPEVKMVLSIDRLDYTKGIPNRLRAFEFFLEKYPEYREKVTLIMLSVPSRTDVEQYQLMKNEVDGLVGKINGRFSTINWQPVWYFYRSMPFENLIDLYTTCEIAFLTPIRDGMNLVAKEYVACRVNKKGVLILSEMAGVAKEMSEALIINPHNFNQIADSIKDAIEMPECEQEERLSFIQERVKHYNVKRWASDFTHALDKVPEKQGKYTAVGLNAAAKKEIKERYKQSNCRVLFLDYDGTLVGFKNNPASASPDKELYNVLDQLSADKGTELVLISGRDKNTFERWFKDRSYSLITEHGIWSRKPGGLWEEIEKFSTDWKENIKEILQFYTDRTPGSFIEEKTYSLVWHYRKVDPELARMQVSEMREEVLSLIAGENLEILDGNKVMEIKSIGVNKGKAAVKWIQNKKCDFVLGAGDDWTDEYLFKELPESAYTVKVGVRNTKAKYYVKDYMQVRDLLKELTLIK